MKLEKNEKRVLLIAGVAVLLSAVGSFPPLSLTNFGVPFASVVSITVFLCILFALRDMTVELRTFNAKRLEEELKVSNR